MKRLSATLLALVVIVWSTWAIADPYICCDCSGDNTATSFEGAWA